MEVETSANGTNSSSCNFESSQVNGINGHDDKPKSSSHKSEHRDKHRDKSKSSSKDHKSSRSDKDRHSSSNSKDKDRHNSSSHKSSKDKDRDRHKNVEKHRDEKKSSSSKDKEHKSSRDKDKTSSSSSKDKDRKDKEKSRHSGSSSKDKHSSSKDKSRHSSSSSKDKKDGKDRDREKKDKDRHSDKNLKNEEAIRKEEDSVDEDDNKLVIKEEPESQESQDGRNVSTASSIDYSLSQFQKDEPRFDVTNDLTVKDEPEESDNEEDIPLRKPFAHRHKLSARMDNSKRKIESDDEDDDVPLNARKKIKKEKKVKTEKKKKKRSHNDYEQEDEEEDFKQVKKEKKIKREIKSEAATQESPKKRGKKKEEEQEVWKWWEEEKKEDGVKWHFLEHKGPVFAPDYEPLPRNIKFYYNGKEMRLSEPAEEVATFYAKMLDHDYTTKDIFNTNFFTDWRKVMRDDEKSKITDLRKCNFKEMHQYFLEQAEKNRNRTKEEKLALKEKNEAMLKEYGFCTIDGHKEKIGNFKIEPPGLFRGRGEHPKMGMLKRRVVARDIIINCSKNSKIPKAPEGTRWKEVRHDNAVTWLASWTENVQNQVKYIMLNPSSKLKGEKDMQKYETARRLHKCIEKIRREYKDDWKSKEMRIRQRAVALYFIDKLALRAGNEKDEDQADTVGCCSLRVEHISLHEEKDGKEWVVVFDFLGKDSIRYYNEVPVEKRVFKNLQLFMENKEPSDDLFDRLNTAIMNKHLNELMEGLTAKVFRTYNASWTLQQQLDELTDSNDTVAEKILSYNRANRAVAILCNHQRSVPKGHEKSMEKLKEKIDAKRETIRDAERQVKDAQKDAKRGSVKEKTIYDKKKKTLQRLKEQLQKLEILETDRDENKTIALGTSKLNYLDPRISVAWCKKNEVPIEKIYNKTQRDKFRWAIDMAGPDYVF